MTAITRIPNIVHYQIVISRVHYGAPGGGSYEASRSDLAPTDYSYLQAPVKIGNLGTSPPREIYFGPENDNFEVHVKLEDMELEDSSWSWDEIKTDLKHYDWALHG